LPKVVSVALGIPLRKTFSYLVPPEWESAARPGARVLVPFAERVLSGVIVCEEEPGNRELRAIAEVLEEAPSVSPELLESTRRLAERFFAPWGEMLRAALPARLASPERARYEITSAGAAALSFVEEGDRGLLETLLRKGRATRRDLLPAGATGDRLRELESRGFVRPVGAARGRRPRMERTYAPVNLDADSRAVAAGRSRKAGEALAWLNSLGRGVTAEEARCAGFSAAVWKRLVEAGAVSVSEQQRRTPWPGLSGAPSTGWTLTGSQSEAVDRVTHAVRSRRFTPILLHGVTGSGKTEVYLRAIAAALADGRGAVWLVPEIALTPVFARSLAARFGDEAVVLHSSLSEGERSAGWAALREGRARVVIGPRSAVFAPLPDIGLFVVDEEHDSSYKQEESPRYDARDAAAVRAQAFGAAVILGSATPSLESEHAAREGRIERLRLPERVERRPLPEVVVVDLKDEPAIPQEKGHPLFSRALVSRLAETFSRGEQAILLVARRGYAPFLLCRMCGESFRCEACSVSRVVHRRDRALVCHYCGRRRPIPRCCETCGGQILEPIGAGTERAAERFAELFPGVAYAVLDADTARRRGGAAGVVAAMELGSVRALIGTQMVAKGHHFENVTALGILSADTLLNFPDFRSGEKTFQLIAQAAGRAGRGDRPGTVHVQTFRPQDPAIVAGARQDSDFFADRELVFRRTFFYPPFSELAAVEISSPDRERARDLSRVFAESLARQPDVVVSEAAPAPLERLRGKWRFQVVLRSRSRRAILAALGSTVPETPPSGIHVAANVDPRNLM
jgi:primosomal protein N' (replication factor Y)